MNEELEAAKKRGYVIFKTEQKSARLGPYSRWCEEMKQPQIYVQITGRSTRTEMDLIFVEFDDDKVREAMYAAIEKLYQDNADGEEEFTKRAFSKFGLGTTYNTIKCKNLAQAERIAQGYVEIYKSIVLPIRKGE